MWDDGRVASVLGLGEVTLSQVFEGEGRLVDRLVGWEADGALCVDPYSDEVHSPRLLRQTVGRFEDPDGEPVEHRESITLRSAGLPGHPTGVATNPGLRLMLEAVCAICEDADVMRLSWRVRE